MASRTTHPHTEKLRHLRRIIGANIRTRRLKRNMTLTKLSRLTGVNLHFLDMFEIGKAEINLNQISSISMVLDCDVTALLTMKTFRL